MMCVRCSKRPASVKPYGGSQPDGLCPQCRYALKRNPEAKRRPSQDGMKTASQDERFWSKVEKLEEGCWEWQAGTDKDGYGQLRVNGKTVQAHRWSYERHLGAIPAGLVIDHLCRNPSCVNPEHLEPVTDAENIHRGEGLAAKNAVKTYCKHGHEFTPENTYVRPDGKGRQCSACKRGLPKKPPDGE